MTLFSFRPHTVALTVLYLRIYLKTARMTTSKATIFYGYHGFRFGVIDFRETICVLHWMKDFKSVFSSKSLLFDVLCAMLLVSLTVSSARACPRFLAMCEPFCFQALSCKMMLLFQSFSTVDRF